MALDKLKIGAQHAMKWPPISYQLCPMLFEQV